MCIRDRARGVHHRDQAREGHQCLRDRAQPVRHQDQGFHHRGGREEYHPREGGKAGRDLRRSEQDRQHDLRYVKYRGHDQGERGVRNHRQ